MSRVACHLIINFQFTYLKAYFLIFSLFQIDEMKYNHYYYKKIHLPKLSESQYHTNELEKKASSKQTWTHSIRTDIACGTEDQRVTFTYNYLIKLYTLLLFYRVEQNFHFYLPTL